MRRALKSAILAVVLAGAASAQTTERLVSVRVVDPRGFPVVGAELVVRDRRDGAAVARTVTDSNGSTRVSWPSAASGFEIELRRLGFISTRRLLDERDSASAVVIRLARMPAALDAVRTTDRPLPRDMRPTIDSSEIAASPRAILYLEDIIHKLRPAIFYQAYRCHGGASSPPLRTYVNHEYVPAFVILQLRLDIHAEQIAEMHYVNCFDKSLSSDDHPQAGHLYITLKDGYAFSERRGTYKLEAAPTDAPFVARFRGRIIGLYDALSGSPLVGATVTDLATGMSANTSATGAVSLFFVDTAGSVLRLSKAGYASQVLAVGNSPGSSDLTLLLVPTSPTAASSAISRDSVSKLDAVGFTFRRTAFAPVGAVFLASDELANFPTVSQVFDLFPNDSCGRGDVRIDGAPIGTDVTRRSLDQMLKPDMVIGVELYRRDPPQSLLEVGGQPDVRGSTPVCTTIFWTR